MFDSMKKGCGGNIENVGVKRKNSKDVQSNRLLSFI